MPNRDDNWPPSRITATQMQRAQQVQTDLIGAAMDATLERYRSALADMIASMSPPPGLLPVDPAVGKDKTVVFRRWYSDPGAPTSISFRDVQDPNRWDPIDITNLSLQAAILPPLLDDPRIVVESKQELAEEHRDRGRTALRKLADGDDSHEVMRDAYRYGFRAAGPGMVTTETVEDLQAEQRRLDETREERRAAKFDRLKDEWPDDLKDDAPPRERALHDEWAEKIGMSIAAERERILRELLDPAGVPPAPEPRTTRDDLIEALWGKCG